MHRGDVGDCPGGRAGAGGSAGGQGPGREASPAEKAAPAKPGGKIIVPPAREAPIRKYAPGVESSADQQRPYDETFSRHNVTELVAVDTNFNWAKDVPFRHEVWMLEFKFLPIHMMWVDIPSRGGRMERKLVWYMIYAVKNPGKVMVPVEAEDKTYTVKLEDKPLRFIPTFTLEVHDRLENETAGFTKAYPDKLIPVAFAPIRVRENKNVPFLTSVQMADREIAPGEEVRGIAMWEGIDPRNVWFSVYVEGLTNAYRFKDDPGKYGDRTLYRSMYRKVLKLNFWRPGDEYTEKETQVRYGAPGKPQEEWVWRRAF